MSTYLNHYPKDVNYIIFSYIYPVRDMKQLYDIYKNDNERDISCGIYCLKEYIMKHTIYRLDLSIYEYKSHLDDTLELYNYIQSYCFGYIQNHRHETAYENMVDNLCNQINFHSLYKLHTVFAKNDIFQDKTVQEIKKQMMEFILELNSGTIDDHVADYYEHRSIFRDRLKSCIALLL